MSRLAYAFDRGSARARFAYAVRKGISAVRAAPMPHLVAVASIAAALLLCAIVGATLVGARSILSEWSRQAELTAYLAPGTSAQEAARLTGLVEGLSKGKVHYVSPDAAIASLAASMGDAGKSLLELGENPLSGSLEIDLGPRAPEEKEEIAEKIAALAGVEEVDRGEALGAKVAQVAGAMEALASVLLPVLLLGAAVLVGSVVRLGVHDRRREIAILRLVGATDGFIRAPLWVEGTLSGLAGGLVAAAGIVAVSLSVGSRLAGALELPTQLDPAALLNPLLLGAVVIAGGAVGLVATALSVERQLR